ncbi:MAG: diguanylate cyclase [Pseudomonadota bacterium]
MLVTHKNKIDPQIKDDRITSDSIKNTINLLSTQKEDLEIALITTMEHGDLIEQQLNSVNEQLKLEIKEKLRAEETLTQLVATIKLQKQDLEIALYTAIEHGDAIQNELYQVNKQLNSEIGERNNIELKLQSMVLNLNRQKEDLELLVETIATHGDEISSQMEQQLSSVEQQVMTDALTGICNRRCYDKTLEKEWHRNARNQTPLSMLVLDIDHFKNYNDSLGHLSGDACLKQIATALTNIPKRCEDTIARYGGEEFIVLLPQSDINNATNLAENIRKTIENLAIKHPDSISSVVTFSIGVATVIPDSKLKPSTLFDKADTQLYIAKYNGRNRVENGKNLSDSHI